MAATVRAKFPSGTVATSGAGPITQSVTVNAGDVLEAHATVSAGTDTGMSVAITANGASPTGSLTVHSNTQTSGFEQVAYWTAPATGTYNVVATVSGGTPDSVGLKVYAISGTDGNAPTITSAGTPNDTTLRTAASASGIVIPNNGIGISHFCAGSAFSSTGQTNELLDTIGGSSAATAMAGASAAGSGGSVTFTATISASDWYGVIVTVWAPAGGGVTPALEAAHWKLVPPGGISPASPRQLPFPSWSGNATAPLTAQTTTWFTRVGDTTTPELLVSAEDWGLLCNGGLNHGGDFAATYDDYFSHRQAQGYNSILVSMFSFTTLSGGANGPDSDGTYPFNTNSTNPSNPANTTFWGRRDSFLATASTYGFRVMLNASTPLVHAGSFTASWTSTQWTDYGTFLGNRYPASTYPHILWMLGDDYFDDIDSNLTAFTAALRAAGGTQPITIQNYQEASSRYDIYNGGTRPWGAANAQYNFGYSYNVSYDVVEKMGNEANPIPYFWGDGTFLNTGGITGITDVQLMRRLVWWALSSGSKGFQVGDNDMWPWDATALGFVTSKTFYTTVIPAIASYFRGLPNWHQLKADTASQLVTAGRGTHAAALVSGGSGGQYLSDSDSYVTASFIQTGLDAGKLAVIYMSHGSTITIDESKMVPGYVAFWVDPKSCATSVATPGTTYNSTAKGTNSDGQNDWVLVLMDSALAPSGAAVTKTYYSNAVRRASTY